MNALPNAQEILNSLGWNEHFEKQFSTLDLDPASNPVMPARIVGEEKSEYRLTLADGRSARGFVRGKIHFNAKSNEDYPSVGDWVLCRAEAVLERVPIDTLLERQSAIVRTGADGEPQVIAANIDTVLIATSLNADFNERRLERYVSLALGAGARPLILLTKSDLEPKAHEIAKKLMDRFTNVMSIPVSQKDLESLETVRKQLTFGKTFVIVGSSGVGKSTLVNSFIGSQKVKTQGIREDDSKGRHTTTTRSLWATSEGALIIDTPGMRSLQLSDDSEGVSEIFSEIETLQLKCKFSNCQHQTEPGCAIRAAIASGDISEGDWVNYKKLLGEALHEQKKAAKRLAAKKP